MVGQGNPEAIGAVISWQAGGMKWTRAQDRGGKELMAPQIARRLATGANKWNSSRSVAGGRSTKMVNPQTMLHQG